mmetsp:Transcript_131409/g.420428  ORF Transcript_131409/g.420428 Transcript_131409/m.420428 type:complete len:288 (+) Transcript_131409:222-1085(+)
MAANGSGRNLAILEAVLSGAILFEEHPMLVSGADPLSCDRQRARWHSYMTLEAQAAGGDAAANVALRSFGGLSCGSMATRRIGGVVGEVDGMISQMVRGNPLLEGETDELKSAMLEVALKWRTNQFSFENGSGRMASALFRRSSLLNHSCSPTVHLACQKSPIVSGAFAPGDGRIVVRAICDLEPGEELCWNYGPEDLPSWPLQRRRQYLLETHAFICECPRCASEASAGLCGGCPLAAVEAAVLTDDQKILPSGRGGVLTDAPPFVACSAEGGGPCEVRFNLSAMC